MSWLTYFLIFLAICIVWFVITRIWVNGIDLIISAFKKMLGLNKNNSAESCILWKILGIRIKKIK